MARRTSSFLVLVLLIAGVAHASPGGPRPSAQTEVSKVGGLGRVEVHGKVGAVLQRDEGTVAILDMKNPAKPKVVGRYDTAQQSLDGDLAFSADGRWLFYARQTSNFDEEGVHVLDVSDPTDPTLAFYLPAGGAYRIQYMKQADTEWLVLLDAVAGLTVNRFVPETGALVPVHVDPLPELKVGGPASAGLFYDPKDAKLGVPLLYVTTGKTGLQIFDYSDPSAPVELGAWEEVGLAEVEVDASKGRRLVYAATEYWFDKTIEPEIVVLDATKPEAIRERGRYSFGLDPVEQNWIQGMDHAGGKLYVAHSTHGLRVLQGSGRTAATFVPKGARNESAGVTTGPYAIDVESVGSWIYLTDAATGVLTTLRR